MRRGRGLRLPGRGWRTGGRFRRGWVRIVRRVAGGRVRRPPSMPGRVNVRFGGFVGLVVF